MTHYRLSSPLPAVPRFYQVTPEPERSVTSPMSSAPPTARRPHSASRLLPGGRIEAITVPLLVASLTAVGAALRIHVAHQPIFADELSTYWIVKGKALSRVLASVHSNDEISPPLSFVASWLTMQLGDTPELLRLPSLLAGIATIPLIYLLGRRLVGRAVGLVAAALTTFSPFMIYYSAEARGYALMMFLVVLSTFAMLVAADTRRVRWWGVYALATCAAVYSHYTCVFVLGAQFLWLLWARPASRRAAVTANLAAVVGFLPWISGLLRDFRSPTTEILSRLQPFTPHDVVVSLQHWAIGYPYVAVGEGLTELPGTPALAFLTSAILLALAGLMGRIWRQPRRGGIGPRDRRLALVVLLAVAVPIGAAIVSSFSTHLFGVRNLAASWPGFALSVAALVSAAGRRLRFAAAFLVIAAFALGAEKMLTDQYRRPDYRAAAGFIDSQAGPRDVVVDGTAILSPGPLSPMDVVFRVPHRVFRAGSPQQNDQPFNGSNPRVTPAGAVGAALAAAKGGRIFFVGYVTTASGRAKTPPALARFFDEAAAPIRQLEQYRLVDTRLFPGLDGIWVRVYAVPDSSQG